MLARRRCGVLRRPAPRRRRSDPATPRPHGRRDPLVRRRDGVPGDLGSTPSAAARVEAIVAGAADTWPVPRWSATRATRQRGTLTVRVRADRFDEALART